MFLKDILNGCEVEKKDTGYLDEFDVKNVCRNHVDAGQDSVFFCLSNDENKANEFCSKAIENGAIATVSNFDLPYSNSLKSDDVRKSFALACKNFYEKAVDDLSVIGVTGTNGKTSTTQIIAQILKNNGKNAGVIGTSGVYYNGKILDCPLTTPDADFLHKTFLDMKNSGVKYVVMEVSAHAIAQKRVEGIKFDIGVLTNITQDHLDYFKTMDNYEKVKHSFFTPKHVHTAVVCIDDERARKLIDKTDVPITTYGITRSAGVSAKDISYDLRFSNFTANVNGKVFDVRTNLVGKYNIYNSLASLAVCDALGLNSEQMKSGLSSVEPVEGRFNVIDVGQKYAVVDYAHTPDGLYNVLKTARNLTNKKICVVFGCGGNRDKLKRAQMGQIAEKYADLVCLTNDNPRLEKPIDIIKDIEKGMKKNHYVIEDRANAICKMLDYANKGDLVIVAGKGAEKYQEIGTTKHPYNDFDVILEYANLKTRQNSNEREKI